MMDGVKKTKEKHGKHVSKKIGERSALRKTQQSDKIPMPTKRTAFINKIGQKRSKFT